MNRCCCQKIAEKVDEKRAPRRKIWKTSFQSVKMEKKMMKTYKNTRGRLLLEQKLETYPRLAGKLAGICFGCGRMTETTIGFSHIYKILLADNPLVIPHILISASKSANNYI